MSESKCSVLVAGAQGVIGRAAEHFSSLPATSVYGLSRRQGEKIPGVVPINVVLLSPEDVKRAIAPLKDVTHIVFGAYVEKEHRANEVRLTYLFCEICWMLWTKRLPAFVM